MNKIICLLLLNLLISSAGAAECPDFYRFVDFGQTGRDGVIYRGGSVLRAESLEGESLLEPERTECMAISEISSDGHGNPIPVVSSIHYNPDKASLPLAEFSVAALSNLADTAEESAEPHRQRLKQTDTEIAQGSNFLCATTRVNESQSCQIVSPFSTATPLVVYCKGPDCTIPVLAIDDQLAASAKWIRTDPTGNSEAAAVEIVEKIQDIHSFLKPLLSLTPR